MSGLLCISEEEGGTFKLQLILCLVIQINKSTYFPTHVYVTFILFLLLIFSFLGHVIFFVLISNHLYPSFYLGKIIKLVVPHLYFFFSFKL